MMNHCEPQWDGWNVAEAAATVFSGEEPLDEVCRQRNFTPAQVYAFALISITFPRLIANEICGVQPLLRPDDKVYFEQELLQTDGLMGKAVCSKAVYARPMSLVAQWDAELNEVRGDALFGVLNQISREIGLEQNLTILNDLWATGRPARKATPDEILQSLYEKNLFHPIKKPVTHLVMGVDAANDWIKSINFRPLHEGKENDFCGLQLLAAQWGPHPVKVYKTAFWQNEKGRRVLALHRGKGWCQVASVWAPYVLTVTNTQHILREKVESETQKFNLHSVHNVADPERIAILDL
jgi:hypothetical protein